MRSHPLLIAYRLAFFLSIHPGDVAEQPRHRVLLKEEREAMVAKSAYLSGGYAE